jgi:PAS domain S-box-containing protein
MSKILIADDLEANRYFLEALLKGHGHQVTVAANGAEALAKAEADPPDLIISDILMPVMDGFALCREWQSNPALKASPFVFYTATYVDRKDEAFGLSLGATQYLLKPMEPDELIRKIDAVLQASALQKKMAIAKEIDDSAYLKGYNEALFRKLEDKMRQLEEANHLLTQEVIERRQTELQLQRLSTAVEYAVECILIADARGQVEYANPAFETIMGLTGKEIVGQDLQKVSQVASEVSVYQNIKEKVLEGQVWTEQLEARNSQGQTLIFDTTVSPIRNQQSRISGFVVVMRDVTERKRLEKHLAQSQKMEAIGTLAGGIAHDFNNILSAIVGYTDLASFEVPADSRISRHLECVLSACDRAKNLVEQILTFSRKAEREKVLLDLRLIIEECLKLLRATLPSTIEIKTYIPAGSYTVSAEPVQLHQVVLNICTNAAHAMRDHGGLLEICMKRLDIDQDSAGQYRNLNPGEYYLMTISDTGCGMTPEVVSRVFEPFFTTKEPGEGTGLGLSVAHGIIRDHGGTIGVYSEPGRGTTFKVYLPAAQGQFIPRQAEEAGDLLMGRERILLVDDERTLVDLTRQMLERLGYQVEAFDSSPAALAAYLAAPDRFDLIITDQTMPRLTGAELAVEALKVRPDLPIIILTGYSVHISVEKAKALGVRQVLMKPLVVREVARAVREVLGETAPQVN